ncbi:MBL fold metallo-hydrolase [Rhodoferax koreense]|nr:MBL fold metallo-hydrolase [Rhodoferax koreense]
MNELESQLRYPLGETLPAPGTALEVAPGVYWIRMALPFVLDHINLWLLRDEMDAPDGSGTRVQGWTVVDCCIDRPEARAQWEGIFEQHLQGLPILRVIVTHMHPDHIGLAHWLCAKWQAPLWISGTDYFVARLNTMGTTGNGGQDAANFFRMHGLQDPKALAVIGTRSDYFAALVPALPRSFHRMQDGDVITIGARQARRRWRCISGYGHAPEHIALYSEAASGEEVDAPSGRSSALLIGGDMMLPRISTNVSVYDNEPESNALQQFLDSIDKFAPLATDTLTLPAHGKPFQGLHTRIAQLHAHHRQHLNRVLAGVAGAPCSAADVLPVMFRRKLDAHQTTFAMGEAIAHLHKLWFDGDLHRALDADGVMRFSVTAQGQRRLDTIAVPAVDSEDVPVNA